jgi:hypothetical protein
MDDDEYADDDDIDGEIKRPDTSISNVKPINAKDHNASRIARHIT